VDYFPSYELVTSAAFGADAFEANLRSVHPDSVARVMSCFFAAHDIETPAPALEGAVPESHAKDEALTLDDGLMCEEILLDAFSK
jgi:hypothetical protein